VDGTLAEIDPLGSPLLQELIKILPFEPEAASVAELRGPYHALTFGAGLVITAVMAVTPLVLGIPALALRVAFKHTAPTIVYLSLAGIVALGVLLTLVSVANTCFWNYLTRTYLPLAPRTPTN